MSNTRAAGAQGSGAEGEMGVREALNKKPGVALGLGVALAAAAVALGVWTDSSGISGELSEAYYSVDDGKTWFADDIDKVYPFDHGGKPAVRAYVYQCPGGEPFVGVLERFNDASRKQIEELKKRNTADSAAQLEAAYEAALEVKRPGDPRWIGRHLPEAAATMQPACKSGSGTPAGVYP
ncbi:MAG TPA: hypothetical protein VF624_14045 [Tepidisphaeraceae bacterium]